MRDYLLLTRALVSGQWSIRVWLIGARRAPRRRSFHGSLLRLALSHYKVHLRVLARKQPDRSRELKKAWATPCWGEGFDIDAVPDIDYAPNKPTAETVAASAAKVAAAAAAAEAAAIPVDVSSVPVPKSMRDMPKELVDMFLARAAESAARKVCSAPCTRSECARVVQPRPCACLGAATAPCESGCRAQLWMRTFPGANDAVGTNATRAPQHAVLSPATSRRHD